MARISSQFSLGCHLLIIHATHGQLIELQRPMQLVYPDHLQGTCNTASKVLLNVILILRSQLMLLQVVDVSCDLIVHRSGDLKQNVESQQHPIKTTEPPFHSPKRVLQGSNLASFCIASAIAADATSFEAGGRCGQIQRHVFVTSCLVLAHF